MPPISTLLNLLKTVLNGLLKGVRPVTTPVGQITPSNTVITSKKGVVEILRNRKVGKAVFGVLRFKDFQCFTLENADYLFESGLYIAQLDKSPRLGYVCPHLQVPKRDQSAGGDAGLRVHVANEPSQLRGCIAIGQELDLNSVRHSQVAFDSLIPLLPQHFLVSVSEHF